MAADFSVVLDELNTTLKSIEAVLRVDDMRNEPADLEQQAAAAYDQARLGAAGGEPSTPY